VRPITTPQWESPHGLVKQALVETPPTGVYHPHKEGGGYFASAGEYLAWHRRNERFRTVVPVDAPVVALLLYR
jgi:cobalamin biosynthesis Mg chelatase CobN